MGKKKLNFEEFFGLALDQLVLDPFKTKVIVKYTHKK